MHIVIFGDQHVETLGGAQVSTRLQRRYLERAGHTVSIVAPRRHGSRATLNADDPAYIDTPSVPITLDREYSFTWPGERADAFIDRAMATRGSVDLVHVQADFWGAFLGYRFASRHGLPVVHTMHNRVDVGIRATAPFPGTVLRVLDSWRESVMPEATPRLRAHTRRGSRRRSPAPAGPRDDWSYLRGLARGADAVTAPSAHFARRLEQHGVFDPVDVVWNGIDDDVLERALAAGRDDRAAGPVRLVWLGRMSPEKRLLPFLEAVAMSGVDAEVEVIGGGGQLAAARRLVERRGMSDAVTFAGRLPYEETLQRIGEADALVQTSIGFETQGMTPFEAACMGTPSVVSDPDIADELGSGIWRVTRDGAAATDDSVAGLSAALRRAVRDIEAGTAPRPDPEVREKFRQSSRTAAMIEVYRRVLR